MQAAQPLEFAAVPPQKQRFTEVYKLTQRERRFAKRRVGYISWAAAFALAAFALLTCFLAWSSGYVGNSIHLVWAVLIVLISYGLFMALWLGRMNDLMLANEFQNALFAGSAGAGTKLCMIFKGDSPLIYATPQTHRFLAQRLSNKVVDLPSLLMEGGIDEKTVQKILSSQAVGRPESFTLYLPDHDHNSNDEHVIELTLEPIERPEGYYVLRAIESEYGPGHDSNRLVAFMPVAMQILDSLPVGIYLTDATGNLLYINRFLCTSLGYERSELVGSHVNVSTLLSPQTNVSFDVTSSYEGPIPFKDKKGAPLDTVLYHTHEDPFSHDGGQKNTRSRKFGVVILPSALAAIVQDLPKQEHAASQDFPWHAFFDSSPIAMMVLDDQGHVLRSNRAARGLTGKGEFEQGWNLVEALSPATRELVTQALQDCVTRKQAPAKPLDVTMAWKASLSASLYLSPRMSGAIAYMIDTTEQKNLEQRFVHSQKMQAVGQLAGGIAHDFNNLLTAMMGFCDLLLIRHPAGDQSFADIMQVKQNASRAANLVRQLLAFSRKQTLQPEVINITDVLAELSNLIRRLIGENIELKMVHGRDLGLVQVDQGQLEQVIINLAVNARDAMANGGELAIRTSNVLVDATHPIDPSLIPPAEDEIITDGEYVRIEVADTGFGIPPEIITKIFEPFFSTKEVGSGTGLGLSTVYGIVKQTGGYIYVASELGKGTNFAIFLKRHGNADAASLPPKVEDHEKGGAPMDLTGIGTVLLVEDEAPVRIFSARALRNKGYTVLEADSGETALDIVREQGNDINMIITDVVMPGINGPNMVQEIQKLYPGIKVIFISGYAEDTFVRAYGTERKFHFLPKPFTLKQLLTKTKEVLERD